MGIMKKYKRAFTLTEVLIAIAIVGVLAAIILPMVITKYQTQAFEGINSREKDCIADSSNFSCYN